jgi:hypothetical protein
VSRLGGFAAGPLRDDHFRELSILTVDVEEARRLKAADPAVSQVTANRTYRARVLAR